MKHLTTLIVLTTLPGLVLAHGDAGHGLMANLEHVLTSAAHLWPLAVTAVVAGSLKRPVQRLLKQRASRKA
jgi:hypothetical protein